MKAGTDYLPTYNWEPGMNDEVAYADRAGYNTSVTMLTEGVAADWGDFGSLEVAPTNYEMDPMGEDRTMMTFPAGKAMGHVGMMATEGSGGMQPTQRTVGGGKSVDISSPQNYNSIANLKKKS
jgi:hypothetical protein